MRLQSSSGSRPRSSHFRATARLRAPNVATRHSAELLERRPDVAAAERLMAQANAQLGARTRGVLPHHYALGERRGSLIVARDVAIVASRLWSLGASAVQTVLDGGARRGDGRAVPALHHCKRRVVRQRCSPRFSRLKTISRERSWPIDPAAAVRKHRVSEGISAACRRSIPAWITPT